MTDRLNKFPTIIYQQPDVEVDPRRTVWVRISPSAWGISIATFKDQPTEETPEWQCIAAFHFDPCYNNQSKVVAWNERSDPENSDGRELILVVDIDNWKPQFGREP